MEEVRYAREKNGGGLLATVRNKLRLLTFLLVAASSYTENVARRGTATRADRRRCRFRATRRSSDARGAEATAHGDTPIGGSREHDFHVVIVVGDVLASGGTTTVGRGAYGTSMSLSDLS